MSWLRCCCAAAEYSQRLFDFCIAFKVQFVVAAAPTVNLTSAPSLSFSSRLLFSHSPPLYLPLCQPVSAQLNVIISNCLWAAAALLPLPTSGCLPLAPFSLSPLAYELLIFLSAFFAVFFVTLCIGFPSLVSFGAKFFLRQLHFLPLFAALATHICQLSNATPFPYPF